MPSPRSLLAAALTALTVALAACTGGSGTTSTDGATPSSPSPSRPDPLVPYSPAPTPFVERTTGFLHETLTLPASDGGTIHVTLDSTAMNTVFTDGYRPLSVWLTVENAGGKPWTGIPAEHAKISDDLGSTFTPIAKPAPADLYPKPQRYGVSNRNLATTTTIGPGRSVHGVIVFHPTGGNRAMDLTISFDGGTTWGTWVMNLGPF
jgi:hypothetical protein